MHVKDLIPSGDRTSKVRKIAGAAKQGTKLIDKLPGNGRNGDGGGGNLLAKLLPGKRGDEGAQEGVGEGRRMPIQQSVDVAVPVETAWKLWNRYDDYPRFMHRVQSAEKVDPKHVHFSGKIWGISREWDAEITEKRTYEVVAWTSEEGLENSGVVTFHKLGPRLTRIELSLDINPHGPIEKIARGMRFTKRATRADLHRFKAYAEMTGAQNA
jgi:uncharacterized membrane protein